MPHSSFTQLKYEWMLRQLTHKSVTTLNGCLLAKNTVESTINFCIIGLSEAVSLPVIAHGGAGNLKDIYEVIKRSKISGVGIASMLHYDAVKYLPRLKTKIGNRFFIDQIKVIKRRKVLLKEIKNYLRKKNIYTR